jgi:formylglycine-generating enzyme required for sulfatase activity
MPASPPDYADIEIRIDPLRGDSYPVTLVVDGARQYSGRMDKSILPWTAGYSPEQDGERLFGHIFADPDLRAAWGEARSRVRRRICLVISQDTPELHAIPWELLREHITPYPPVTLAAAGDTPFSRYLYGGWEPGQPIQTRPMRMLVAVANPDGLAEKGLTPIDVDKEWQLVKEAANHAGLELDLLPQPCTLAALADKLAEGFHILHLVCHGAYNKEDSIAALYLADGNNQVVRVHDDEIVAALRNRLPAVPEKDRLRLVFLASCETATRSPADAFRGLAPKLVRAGVPVVLAMQDLVPVRTAQAFAGTFYKKLLQHGLVDLASNQARAHVIAERLSGSSIPVLFMRLDGGRLLEVRSKQELAYLDGLIEEFHARYRAEEYTPMPGVAEVARKGVSDRSPLVWVPPEFVMLKKRGGGMQAEVERVPVSDLRNAIEQHHRMVLLGEPGSGKTTTLWDLAYHHAREAQENADAPLPVFVPLDGYTGSEQALQYIKDQVGDLAQQLPLLMKKGRVMLLLDALNEMPSIGYRDRVRRIQTLLSEFDQVPAVVTCRALDYVEELDLNKLEIQPLEPIRQREFLEKYLGHEDGEALFWQLAGKDVADAWRSWQDLGGTWEGFWTADVMPEHFLRYWGQRRTWEYIHGVKLPPLLALGRNPYMLFMTVQVYLEGDGILARNRGELFARFARTLILREERRADPDRWPGANVLERALVRLAFNMQSAGERGTAVDPDWAKQQMAGDDHDPAWLLHLARRASLLDLEGSKVRFVHQLVQEYFAAVGLGERLAAGEDLRRYWPNGWADPSGWEETALLLAGVQDDMTALVKQLLVANPPLAARCIAESGGERPAEATVRTVQQRLVELVTDPRVAIPEHNAAGVAINHVGDPRRGVGLRADGLPDIDWVFVPAKDPKNGRKEFIYGQRGERRTEADFWIARYPITYRQFQAFLDATDGFHNLRWWHGLAASQEHRSAPGEQWFKHWNHPRENVSWYDAIAFCGWLTEKAKEHLDLLPADLDRSRKWKITLPTEWQWEKAARGHDGRKYPWGGDDYKSGYANIDETARFGGQKVGPHFLGKTNAVGMYPQGDSPYGVADLSGNLWEWCLNEYESGKTDVGGSAIRVLRGGSWDYGLYYAAAPVRDKFDPDGRYHIYGVRLCAMILQE